MKTPQSYVIERMFLDGKETLESLARKAGIKRSTLRALVSGACRNRRGRARIEWVIGARVWDTMEGFEDRTTVAPFLGGRDGALVNVVDLRRAIVRLRLAGPGLVRKQELIRWFAETIRQFRSAEGVSTKNGGDPERKRV